MPDFSSLDQIFTMFSPQDLVNTIQPTLGGPLSQVDGPVSQLLAILENSGRGVFTIDDIVSRLNSLSSKTTSEGGPDLSSFLSIWTGTAVPNLGSNTSKVQLAVGPTGSPMTVGSLSEVIGADFAIPPGAQATALKASIITSKSPYFSPATRNTHLVEIFLNSMPSVVLSQLVPFLQVEFQQKRDPSSQLQTMGQLRFLLGAAQKSTSNDANQAMIEGHQVAGAAPTDANGQPVQELDYAGMEMFTSPQTLVNPQPNLNVGTNGTRYVDVLDPFRPFASLEHVTISHKPSGHGFYTYKTANMTIKLHDRSRLNEIADLIRVNIFTGVTIWMTYGWRAPVRSTADGNNPYFDYVNSNLLMREPYQIQNSSFSFDSEGQVTINLQLFTKGVLQMRDISISDQFGDMLYNTKVTKELIQSISQYRQALKLDPPEGLNKEIRVYQTLEAAENGQFPDFKPAQVQAQIAALDKSLRSNTHIDQAAATGLISALKTLYQPTGDGSKFVYKDRYDQLVTKTIATMFDEVRTGPDPFIPTAGKDLGQEITQICDQLNQVSKQGTPKNFQKKAVSFGKLFSVFALRGIISLPPGTVDEAQIFFYNLNDQCGPISNHSVSEFPIAMDDFVSQFADMAKSKGAEKIKLEDFLELVINAQFTDNRAIGYGLTSFYQPWKAGSEPQLKQGKDVEQSFESKVAAYQAQYGPFKQPQIEMAIEVSHERVSDDSSGQSDALQLLSYSSKDAASVSLQGAQGNALKKIMRIHVYDKQANPNKTAALLLRNERNDGYAQINGSIDDFAKAHSVPANASVTQIQQILAAAGKGQQAAAATPSLSFDDKSGLVSITNFGSNQQIKDVVSKIVPTIRFGANGTTVKRADLASKADPKVGSNNLINSQVARNVGAPNGAGALGIPLRVIPAQLNMTSWGCPLATMAQNFFIDFQTGTTLDNLYILTHLSHNFSPGKFETQWTFGYSDGYGVFEGAPNIVQQLTSIPSDMGNTSK